MKLIVIFLTDEKRLDDIVSLMVEAGISQAAMLPSEGLGEYLAKEVPIFAGLRQLLPTQRRRLPRHH